jgi:hypothetical protein
VNNVCISNYLIVHIDVANDMISSHPLRYDWLCDKVNVVIYARKQTGLTLLLFHARSAIMFLIISKYEMETHRLYQ